MRSLIVAVVAGLLLTAGSEARAEWPNLRGRDPERQAELAERVAGLRDERPRLFSSEAELQAVRARIDQSDELQEVYGWLLEWARSDHYYENLWATPNQLIAASVAYRLENRDPAIGRHAAEIADFLIEAEGDSWTWPRIAKGLAVYYDWVYDDLTPAERKRVGEAALHAARQCYDTWRHTEFNNHLYLEYGPLIYVGLSLRDEDINDADARQMLLDGLELMYDNFLPAHALVSGGSGGWLEGMSYHAFYAYEFGQQIQALHHAGGHPIWETSDVLGGDGEWLVRSRRPFDGARVAVADVGPRDPVGRQLTQYLPVLIDGRRDGWARWYMDEMKAEVERRHEAGAPYIRVGSAWWPYVLWYDPAVEPVDLAAQPLARHFTGIGWATMRSDWSEQATFAVFVCPPVHTGGHQQADYNHFAIHHNGRLAIDSGNYEADAHRANYYARSIAHNTVLVHDPDEPFSGGSWGGGKAGAGANDGGQRYTFGPDRVADITEKWRFGKIRQFDNDDRVTVVVGDATNAYREGKVREFTRAFVYLRPNVFVVFDRVESSDAAFAKTWLLHTVNEPSVAEGHLVATDLEGSLTVQTLLPADATTTRVGGEGRAFEVAGVNYPPSEEYDADEAGRWRIEVQPGEPAERDYFLHVLATGTADEPVVPETVVHETDDAVRISVDVDGQPWTLTFNKTGALTPQIDAP